MIIALFNLIGKGLGIVENFTDPDKKTKSFRLLKQKNIKRALDTAEDIIELIDINITQLPEKTKERYQILKRKFNDYD